jgi:uncharacterized membrane protein YkoI
MATMNRRLAAAGFPPSPASAQTCYSTAQARAAVQAGQVMSLSSLIGAISAAVPGQIVSSQLCNINGHDVYLVGVLSNGRVVQVRVDAATGRVSY